MLTFTSRVACMTTRQIGILSTYVDVFTTTHENACHQNVGKHVESFTDINKVWIFPSVKIASTWPRDISNTFSRGPSISMNREHGHNLGCTRIFIDRTRVNRRISSLDFLGWALELRRRRKIVPLRGAVALKR